MEANDMAKEDLLARITVNPKSVGGQADNPGINRS